MVLHSSVTFVIIAFLFLWRCLFYFVFLCCFGFLLFQLTWQMFIHAQDEDTRIIELAMYESDARKVVCEVSELPNMSLLETIKALHKMFELVLHQKL